MEICFVSIIYHHLLKLFADLILLRLQLQVQERFEVDIKELPEQIDTATYSMFFCSFEFCVIVVCVETVNQFNKLDSG